MAGTTTGSLGRQGERTAAHLAALARREDVAVHHFTSSVGTIWENTRDELERVLAQIEARRAGGEEVSQAWVLRATRLRAVLHGVADEVAALGPDVAREFHRVQNHAAIVGAKHAADELPNGFAEWSAQDLRAIVAALAPDTPLTRHVANLGGEAADRLRHIILTGVATGNGVPWMLREAQRAVTMPAWRLETLIRTESMRAFRYSSAEAFRTNPAVVRWRWVAKLDARTCPACVVLHGQEFDLDEPQDGHPRCRCAMVPVTESWEDILGPSADGLDLPREETGREWLERQPDDVARAVLGPAKFAAWKEGAITLDDVVTQDHSPEWGSMRREASLSEILKRKATPPAFGAHLPGEDAALLVGPMTPDEWENTPAPGKAQNDHRYVPPGPLRAQAVLMYWKENATMAKLVAANLAAGNGPWEGIPASLRAGMATPHLGDGYTAADWEADIVAAATWLNAQPVTDVGAVYRGLQFDPGMSWPEVKRRIESDGWSHVSTTRRADVAEMYAGRPWKTRSVRVILEGAQGVELSGVGNLSHTAEVLVSGGMEVIGYRLVGPRGEDYLEVRARWKPSA